MSEQIDYYYGDDVEYAHKRLSSTFVKLKKGGLCYIFECNRDVDGVPSARCVKFSSKDSLNPSEPQWGLPLTNIKLSELDMSPIELGYVFCKRLEKAVYVSRFPMRNLFKQGLHFNGLSFSDGNREYLNPSEIFSPMLNIYPRLKTALAITKHGPYSVPFSRAFAVKSNGDLEYMGRQVVGKVKSNNDSPVAILEPKFGYLQQHLDWSTK